MNAQPPREPMRPRGGITRRSTRRIMQGKPRTQAPDNRFGYYERNKIMGIQEVTLPKTTRKLTYDYGSDLDSVKAMLTDGKNPGDGPFETQGKARAAANSLLEQLGDDGKAYGARVVQKDDGWWFALKVGRKEFKGRTAATDAAAKAAPKTTGNRK